MYVIRLLDKYGEEFMNEPVYGD